jgi:hypothetical protein
MRLVKVIGATPGATLVPPASVKIDLDASVAGPARPAGPPRASTIRGGTRPAPGGRVPRSGSGETSSWWTARATAGEVTGGFTKEEILKTPEKNPRGEDGMFARLERFLESLEDR